MRIKVRGRHTGKDLFKPGERCQKTARYRCETCTNARREVHVEVASGSIFPLCTQCKDLDMGWRPIKPA